MQSIKKKSTLKFIKTQNTTIPYFCNFAIGILYLRFHYENALSSSSPLSKKPRRIRSNRDRL